MQNHFFSVIFHIILVYWCLSDSKFRTKFQVIRGDFKHYSRSTWTIYLIDVKNISVCMCLEFRMWNIGYFMFSTINVKLQCGVNKKKRRITTWFLQMCMYLLMLIAMILNKEQKQDITQILAMAVHNLGRFSNQSSPFTTPE